MRESTTLSRRALGAALPIAALTLAPAVALPAHASSEEAELLDLGRQWLAIHAKHVAHWHVWQALPKVEQDLKNVAFDVGSEAMSRSEWALERRIHALRATTLAGLAVKARIAVHKFDVENFDTVSIERACENEKQRDCQAHAALSLALDVLRLASTAS